MRKAIIAVVLLLTGCFVVSRPAMAEEKKKKDFKSAAKDAVESTVNYPANLANEAVNVVGKAAKDTTKTVGDTVKAAGETLTGKPEKAADIVRSPVEGSARTIKNASEGTVEAPVKAGKKTKEQLDR